MICEACISNLDSVLQYVEKSSIAMGFNEEDVRHIRLATEEVLVNIMHHAYPENKGYVEVLCTCKGRSLVITVKDRGIAFDPIAKIQEQAPLDRAAALEDREVGGLGLYYMIQFIDHVSYRWVSPYNVLTLKKNLNP